MDNVNVTFFRKGKLYGVLNHNGNKKVLPLSNDYEVEFFIMVILSLDDIQDYQKERLIEQVVQQVLT